MPNHGTDNELYDNEFSDNLKYKYGTDNIEKIAQNKKNKSLSDGDNEQFESDSDEIFEKKMINYLEKNELPNGSDSEDNIKLDHFTQFDLTSLIKNMPNMYKATDTDVLPTFQKVAFPKLKPGSPIPKGWMIAEDGSCVPEMKEYVHHKYADPDLYRVTPHQRLLNEVEAKLPPQLKFSSSDRQAFLEQTQSGTHAAYERRRERVLNNPIIDQVINNIKTHRKVRQTNVDLSFKYQNVSPYSKKYNYDYHATTHAFLDIDREKTKIDLKKRPVDKNSGPSMDNSFLSTAWHKATH
jgi:hypothetical protein